MHVGPGVHDCLCNAGYAGGGAEGGACSDARECDEAPCVNGATCTESNDDESVGLGLYRCTCAPGYANGVCETELDEYSALCTILDTGTCDVDIDECVSTPCQNGAACSESAVVAEGGVGRTYSHASPVVTAIGAATDGDLASMNLETYRLSLQLAESAVNVYSIFGHVGHILSMPASYQADEPFGTNIGGVDPALIAASPEAGSDSWLTIGITDGDSDSALASIGIDFASWTAESALESANGAVFWMQPHDGPTERDVVIAQLTVTAGLDWTAIVGAQGLANESLVSEESMRNPTWQELDIIFTPSTVVDSNVDVPANAYSCSCTAGFADGFCNYEFLTEYLTECTVTDSSVSEGGAYSYVLPVVTVVGQAEGLDGYTTYQLSLQQHDSVANVYTIWGHEGYEMILPPAWQADPPFGVNVGGVDPAIVAASPGGLAAFDSWLSVGITDGDNDDLLGTVGIDYSTWTIERSLDINNGGVFYLN
eukprot:SAG31_NODE_5792_length_2326_cov_1.511899_1_plen_482_part_10